MKRFPDPKRSEAAKRGWKTRKLRKEIAERYKRSLAARKGAAKRKITKPRGSSARERALEARIGQLELELIRVKERASDQIKRLKHKIKRIQKPYKVEVQERARKDPERTRSKIVKMVEDRLAEGFGAYQAIYDTWAEVNFLEGYEDIADIRQAFADEGVSPEVE